MDGLHTLISSNIRFDNPADGIQCWDMRRRHLSTILLSHGPFLIGTQEGRRSQLQELAGLLPDFRLCADHRPWLDERMYPCFYLHNDHTAQLRSGDAWLSETPELPGSSLVDSAFPRLCTWVKLRLDGKSLIVFNLHLDVAKSETRLQQCQVLVEEIRRRSSSEDHLVILGDFNDAPNSPVYRYVLAAFPGLYDPWVKLGRAEEASHHSFGRPARVGHRIDWILLDGRLACADVFLDKSAEGHVWPSDHYPLVCRFKF